MGRLIDADKWIEKLSNGFITPNYHPDLGDAFQCMEAEQHNEDIADLITMINEQPTACDVDKVVEQLNGLINATKSEERTSCDGFDCRANDCIECMILHSIDIVKGAVTHANN